MAHELTIRADGYTEMAFVGSTPWHGLGQELKQDASIEEWRTAAGMDWSIESTPVQYVPEIMVPRDYEGQNVLYRSDTKAPLSIVSDRYKTVQPREVLEFFRDLVEESGFRLHTAGTLFGGRRLWALAETGRFAEVTEGDGIGGFLLLSTSADKSLATTARFTSIRVVCNNTLSMATSESANCVSFTHAREFDHDLMKAKLGAAVGSFDGFMVMSQYLQKQRIQLDEAKEFVAKILDSQYVAENEPKENRTFRKIMDLFKGEAKGAELVGNTKWGLLNAVTEYYDHHLPARTADARLNSTWFGNGEAVKAKAIEVLTA
jgi:phage/plasmid-like protein (TIGR03299 family)